MNLILQFCFFDKTGCPCPANGRIVLYNLAMRRMLIWLPVYRYTHWSGLSERADTTGSGSCSRRESAKYPGICRRAFLICKVDLLGWPLNSENPPAIGLEEILDFVRFPCVAAAVWGKIANNMINGSLLDTLVPKLKKLMMHPFEKKVEIGDEPYN